MHRRVLTTLLVFTTLTFAISLEPVQWSHSLTLDKEGELHVFWKQSENGVTFEVGAKSHGYVGLGFSPNGGMAGADIALGWVDHDGSITLQDYHGVGNSAPVLDTQQDYELIGGYENDTHTVLRFWRKLTTCDEHDMILGTDTVRIIWAYSNLDPIGDLVYHGRFRGSKPVLLMHPPFPPIQQRLENSTKQWDVKISTKFVNGLQDSLYWCQIVKLPPVTKKHQVVGFVPILQPGNEAFVHHMVVYECIAPDTEGMFEKYVKSGSGAQCYTPEMPSDWQNCLGFVVTWVVGSEGEVYPENFGIPLGEKYGGATYFMIEMHYDNPTLSKFFDSSGLRIFYTSKLRRYDGSTLALGQRPNPFQMIPPRQHKFTSYTYCPGECTSKTIPTEGIKMYSVLLHAHTAAKRIRLRHIRRGKELPVIEKDNYYDFNYQTSRVLPQQLTILPGDEFIVECDYDTTRRELPTFGGATSREEMCQAFAIYYPRADLSRCFSSPALDTFFHGLGVQKLNGFDFEQGTDRLLEYSYNVSAKNTNRIARATIVNINTNQLWQSLSIREPKSIANMSMERYFSEKKWHERKEMTKLEDYWKKGKYEVWCTIHGLTPIDPKENLHEYPKFLQLPPETSDCPSVEKASASSYKLSFYCLVAWVVMLFRM